MADILSMPRLGSIATMPSRLETFESSIESMLNQLDELHVYLDHFKTIPNFIKNNPKISIYRSEDMGDCHASSRFHILKNLSKTSIIFFIDDDIIYPPDYTATLATVLDHFQGKVIVGVHGRIFIPPHKSYVTDTFPFNLSSELKRGVHVHELGTGTCAFLSNLLDFNVLNWGRYDMDDLYLSIEAQKKLIPRIIVRRPKNWLKDNSMNQEDSLWIRTKKEHTFQSEQMNFLLSLYQNSK
jgi:hypothetical protein